MMYDITVNNLLVQLMIGEFRSFILMDYVKVPSGAFILMIVHFERTTVSDGIDTVGWFMEAFKPASDPQFEFRMRCRSKMHLSLHLKR